MYSGIHSDPYICENVTGVGGVSSVLLPEGPIEPDRESQNSDRDPNM